MRAWLRGSERHRRSLTKAITWRGSATVDTFVISYFVTGKVTHAGTIAILEIVTKLLLYYLHERVWAVIPWGHR